MLILYTHRYQHLRYASISYIPMLGACVQYHYRILQKLRVFVLQDFNEETEDEASLQCHVKFMANEMKKNHKNMELIEDRMKRTYTARRKEVFDCQLTIPNLLSKYPSLCCSTIVLNEAKRIFGFTPTTSALNKKTWRRLLKLTNMKFAPESVVEIECLTDISKTLLLAPTIFKDSFQHYVYVKRSDESNQNISPYPCIIYGSDEFTIFVQHQQVCSTKDFPEAIMILLSLYWVFDIKFAKGIQKTLMLLCFLFNLDRNIINIAVQRVINKLG
ncbi:uncharacterized protein LOC144742620 [Ciona intestinalis]